MSSAQGSVLLAAAIQVRVAPMPLPETRPTPCLQFKGSRMTSSTISIHTTKPTPLDLHSFPPEHTGPVPPLALNTECRTLLGNISFLRAGLL